MLIKKIDHSPPIATSLYLCCLMFALSIAFPAKADKLSKLDKVHLEIISDYSNVAHVTTLPTPQSSVSKTVLIDVREPNEFAVSHIEGAVRVSPDISPDKFLTRFGDDAEDKTYIFYCSVGRRSSELINLVQAGLYSEGAASISNLEGGVFKWHNDKKALINQGGETELVHPYNFWWKRLLNRPKETSYKPN
ncbi:MAG: rhodanese-related sulfurtransferase [Saprospiraceae bacterium]|jgi:rhodanese-related sulfurtransferase